MALILGTFVSLSLFELGLRCHDRGVERLKVALSSNFSFANRFVPLPGVLIAGVKLIADSLDLPIILSTLRGKACTLLFEGPKSRFGQFKETLVLICSLLGSLRHDLSPLC